MKRKLIDKIVYHLTVKPKRYKKVKDPPKTVIGKLLHPEDARQEQYNEWCRRHGIRQSKPQWKNPKSEYKSFPLHTSRFLFRQKEQPEKSPASAPVKRKETEADLISELRRKKIKFTLDDIVFITRDKTGQAVWLEKGSPTAGLQHILYGNGQKPGHEKDFEKALGVCSSDIPDYLQKVIHEGEVLSNEIKVINGRTGYERKYFYDGNYYIVSGIGLNGFIVSAYPKHYRKENKDGNN